MNVEFREMMLEAGTLISDSTIRDEITYAVVILTEKGCILGAVSSLRDMENEQILLDTMRQTDDTLALKVLCLIGDKHIDLPSYRMRKNLCLLNSKNRDAEVFLQAK